MFHFIVVGLGGIILAANAYPRQWNEDIDRGRKPKHFFPKIIPQ
jgi:hypothetical protein